MVLVIAGSLLAVALVVRTNGSVTHEPRVKANLAFTLEDMNGAKVDLQRYAGKPLVINLWATWCGPCREEMPALNALAAEHRSGDAIVLAATDESLEDIRRFEDREMRVAAEVVTFKDERPPYGPLGAMAYEGRPTTIVLDRNGAVRHVFAGPQSLATFEDALRDAL